ncbi:MAG: hypothetical protein J7J25_05565 [Candidatus Omnitrophica bacterium]|nr:hypothetical protein [Candidatus Omnitrophota bacterium]
MKKKKVVSENKLELIKKEIWPKTKKELEKAVDKAKDALSKGESYIKTLSAKSAQKAEELSLKIKREKLIYDLGRTVASTSRAKLGESKKIAALLSQIKQIERAIKKAKA